MKRIPLLLLGCLFWTTPLRIPAQDAATEERLSKLNGLVQDLLESQDRLRKQISELEREMRNVRDEASKPAVNYASQEDLRKLAEKVQEIDRKREADKELILKKISDLAKLPARRTAVSPPAGPDTTTTPDKGYEHVVESGQTLSEIALAFREKGIKVTVDQILKANPGLDATRMQVGQKIFIPAPTK